MKQLIAAASFLIAFSAQASQQEIVLAEMEMNPTATVKYDAAKSKVKKTEMRPAQGWYFE